MREDRTTTVHLPESEEDTKISQAGDEPSDIPVFLRDTSEGKKGNAQDEKDNSAE